MHSSYDITGCSHSYLIPLGFFFFFFTDTYFACYSFLPAHRPPESQRHSGTSPPLQLPGDTVIKLGVIGEREFGAAPEEKCQLNGQDEYETLIMLHSTLSDAENVPEKSPLSLVAYQPTQKDPEM